MRHQRVLRSLCAGAILSGWTYGQTTVVDLRTQSKSVDFTAAPFTRPFKTGTAFPATCGLGDTFFKSDAPAGANIFNCTATNQWSQEGVGATSAGQLADFNATASGPTTLSIGAGCSTVTPCNVRWGSLSVSFTAAASASITAGTGVVYIYLSGGGTLMVGHNLSVVCTSGCVAQSGITAFPPDSIPLFTWTVSNGVLDALGRTDFRSFLSSKNVRAGTGVSTLESNGDTVVSVDQATVGLRVAVPPTSGSACAANSWATDGTYYYLCVSTNLWKRLALLIW